MGFCRLKNYTFEKWTAGYSFCPLSQGILRSFCTIYIKSVLAKRIYIPTTKVVGTSFHPSNLEPLLSLWSWENRPLSWDGPVPRQISNE